MKVKFIKAHPVGIPEGTIREVRKPAARRWLEQGYVEILEGDIEQPAGTSQEAPKTDKKKKK